MLSKMNRIHFLLLTVIFIFSSASKAQINEVDSLLTVLDNELSKKEAYTKKHQEKISFLKETLLESNSPEAKYIWQSKLFEAYQPFICDSAIRYLEQNLQLGRDLHKPIYYYESGIQLAHLLSSSGMYKEAVDILDTIPKSKLTPELSILLISTYDHVYGELSFYSRSVLLKRKYNHIAQNYKDELFNTLDPTSDLYLSMKETKYRDAGRIDSALIINDKRLATISENSNYALIAFHRSLDYNEKRDTEQRKKFLILAAIHDIRSSIKDNASMTLLANIFYKEGEVNRAYDYIRHSMDDANFYNAKLRNVQVSEIQPIIDKAYHLKNDQQKRDLRFFLIISVILFIFSMATLWIIYLQKRKLMRTHSNVQLINDQLNNLNQDLQEVNNRLKNVNNSLAESNHVKEEYIGLFLSICSTYIDKLEDMRRMVSKEIKNGRVAQLLTFTKSGDFIDNELNEFYNNFDQTFLHLYPNFVEEFNELLKPEERIELKSGEVLNTELRIFALIRLGINDSSKIAGLLRYSVNTIYNYRARIKNKSIVPRDDFEKFVSRINSPTK